MTTDFIPKKPHKKSRGGCKTCKTKKIKCDEAQPRCTFCEKRDLTCEYLPRAARYNPPSQLQSQDLITKPGSTFHEPVYFEKFASAGRIVRTPSLKVPTSSGTLSPVDLRAMHFWSLFTSQTISPGSHAALVLQVTVPQLAFENEYLLNVMLGISSLHMQSLLPDAEQSRKETDLYRVKALNSFRQALSRFDPKTQSWEAALITAILLNILCSKDYNVGEGSLVVIHWLTLYRGLASVIMLRSFPEVMQTRVAPIFRRSVNELQAEPVVPYALANMLEEVHPLDPDYKGLEHYYKTLDLLGVLYASLRQDGLSVAFRTRVIGWASFVSQEFTNFSKEKRPRALVLLAHFMVFVKTMKNVWWVDGVADQDIKQIIKLLPQTWLPLLEVPSQALVLTDENEMANLLLSSVDDLHSSVVKTSAREYKLAVRWFTNIE